MGTLTQATRLPDYPFKSDHAGSFGTAPGSIRREYWNGFQAI